MGCIGITDLGSRFFHLLIRSMQIQKEERICFGWEFPFSNIQLEVCEKELVVSTSMDMIEYKFDAFFIFIMWTGCAVASDNH